MKFSSSKVLSSIKKQCGTTPHKIKYERNLQIRELKKVKILMVMTHHVRPNFHRSGTFIWASSDHVVALFLAQHKTVATGPESVILAWS